MFSLYLTKAKMKVYLFQYLNHVPFFANIHVAAVMLLL